MCQLRCWKQVITCHFVGKLGFFFFFFSIISSKTSDDAWPFLMVDTNYWISKLMSYLHNFGYCMFFIRSCICQWALAQIALPLPCIYQEKRSVRPTFSAERIYGGALLAMCSNDFICFYDWAECRMIRRIDVNVKVSNIIATVSLSIAPFFFFPSAILSPMFPMFHTFI